LKKNVQLGLALSYHFFLDNPGSVPVCSLILITAPLQQVLQKSRFLDGQVNRRQSWLTRDEARRIAANFAKLPLNIDQTAKSKSNAHDKGGTNEDSSRRNGACEFPTRCLFGPTRTAGSGGAARRKRSKRRSGSARADGTKRRPGSARAGGFRRQRRPADRER